MNAVPESEIERWRRKYERERKARLEAEAIAERFTRDALHDPLTGLANRSLFLDRLQHALVATGRHRAPLATIVLDLDGFKEINDSMGHGAGDQVLRSVARSLASVIRQSDTVARLGGDEFVILAENLGSDADAAAVAEKALQRIARPMKIDGGTCAITGSIGISLYPRDAGDGEQLLTLADAAMYQAKQAHPNRFMFVARDAPGLLLATG
jgi:diguanylate cyclase (GGDEF)-like protein